MSHCDIIYVAGIGAKYLDTNYKRSLDRALLSAETEITHLMDWSDIMSRLFMEDYINNKEFKNYFNSYFDMALGREGIHREFADPTLRMLLRGTVKFVIEDIYRYFSEQKLRDQLKKEFLTLLAVCHPQFVIAHGVGSIIAYEALCEEGLPLPVFVTVGSYLSLGLVKAELRQSLKVNLLSQPVGVCKWVNIYDPIDVFATETHLHEDYSGRAIEDLFILNEERDSIKEFGPSSFSGYLKSKAMRLVLSKNWLNPK